MSMKFGEMLEAAIKRDEGKPKPYELFEFPGFMGKRGDYDIEKYGFTAWTEARVYFPVEYDGNYGVMSVPRHPCHEPTQTGASTRCAYDDFCPLFED